MIESLPGGLRFDVVRHGQASSPFARPQAYGILSWGQFIRFNAIRIGKTFHVTDNIPIQGKAILRQISIRTGVRIVDTRERALGGNYGISSTDTDALLSGEERQQVELAQELIRLNPNRPAPDFWDKMEMVNEAYKSLALFLPNPIDVVLRFKDLVDDPSLKNVGELLYAATFKPLENIGRQVWKTFDRLF